MLKSYQLTAICTLQHSVPEWYKSFFGLSCCLAPPPTPPSCCTWLMFTASVMFHFIWNTLPCFEEVITLQRLSSLHQPAYESVSAEIPSVMLFCRHIFSERKKVPRAVLNWSTLLMTVTRGLQWNMMSKVVAGWNPGKQHQLTSKYQFPKSKQINGS